MLGIQQEQESAKQSIMSLQRQYQEIEWEKEKGVGKKEELENNRLVAVQLYQEQDALYRKKEATLRELEGLKAAHDREIALKLEAERRKAEEERRREEEERRKAAEVERQKVEELKRKEEEERVQRLVEQRVDAEREERERKEAAARDHKRIELEILELHKLSQLQKKDIKKKDISSPVEIQQKDISVPVQKPLQVNLVEFNDFVSEEPSFQIRQRLATEAQSRLHEMIQKERQRNSLERDQFYASLPRNTAPTSHYIAPRPSIRRPVKRAPSTRSLINLSEPLPPAAASPTVRPDYATELCELLTPAFVTPSATPDPGFHCGPSPSQPPPPRPPRLRSRNSENELNGLGEENIYMNLEGEFRPPPACSVSVPTFKPVSSPADQFFDTAPSPSKLIAANFYLSIYLDSQDPGLYHLVSVLGKVLLDLYEEVRVLHAKKVARDTTTAKLLNQRKESLGDAGGERKMSAFAKRLAAGKQQSSISSINSERI
eukprot:sb/3479784/